jgi:thiamine transporter ThiT
VFTALVAGLLSGLLTLLIGMFAPSCSHQYWIGLSAFIGVTLAYVFAWKRWPAQTHRLLTMKRFRGW